MALLFGESREIVKSVCAFVVKVFDSPELDGKKGVLSLLIGITYHVY